MTAVGNAQLDTAIKKFGTASGMFDGSGDVVKSANHADWDLGAAGSGDFAVDFWLMLDTDNTGGLVGASNNNTGWLFFYNAGNSTLSLYDGGTSTLTWNPTLDQWYHVALTRSGTTIRCFIDGTLLGTFADKDMSSDGNPLVIGALDEGGTSSIDAWMDEIRISKGTARWTANFTPPASEYA